MADVSDVIAALECFETKHKPCARCPFNPAPGMQWAYGCQRGERDIAEKLGIKPEVRDVT